jgi:hypothetical protein
MTKAEYLHALLMGRLYLPGIIEIALVYWHSDIPISLAKDFMENYISKLESKRSTNVKRTGYQC